MSLFRRGPRPRLERKQALAGRPVRNPDLPYQRQENGEVAITLRRRRDLLTRLLSLLFVIPRQKQVVLDDVGADIWELCDGEHTVEELIASIASKYKLEPREAEVSLLNYLRQLGRRRLIGILVTKEDPHGTNRPA
jgi:hypothetical protein